MHRDGGSGLHPPPYGKPYVTASRTSGLPTQTFTVRGKYVWAAACPGPVPITFKFYWYKVPSSKVLLWTKTVSTCAGSVVDTGSSPAKLPPAPLNYPATFVIQVFVYSSTGAAFGPDYQNTLLYRVQAPRPSPSPRASPSADCGQPGAQPCASPSSTPCSAQTAAVFGPGGPGGTDVVTLILLAALAGLPIGGLAMVSSPGLWSRRKGWRRLAMLMGLSILLLSAGACTAPNQIAQGTPTQSEPAQSPSPSPSPSPSC